MHVHVVGCSPAWPNPGGAQSGYLVEEDGRRLLLDCGPGVLPRLRRLEPWPRLDAIVITHFHLDHWGDLVPWAFGGLFGAGRERGAARALAAARRPRDAARARSRPLRERDPRALRGARVRGGDAVHGRRLRARRLPDAPLRARELRPARVGRRPDARLQRRLRAVRRARRARPRRRPLPLRGDPRPARAGHPRPPHGRRGARRLQVVRRAAGSWSSTGRTSSRSPTASNAPTTALEQRQTSEPERPLAEQAVALDRRVVAVVGQAVAHAGRVGRIGERVVEREKRARVELPDQLVEALDLRPPRARRRCSTGARRSPRPRARRRGRARASPRGSARPPRPGAAARRR